MDIKQYSSIIQYSVVLYRDHGDQGFLVLKYHPKTGLTFTLYHLSSIAKLGIAKLKNVSRSFLTHSKKFNGNNPIVN